MRFRWCSWSSGALVVSGLVEIYFSYQENKAALARVQREKAVAAAVRIEQFVRELEHQLAWIAQTPWGARGVSLDQRRLDSLRLLRHVPAVTEVSHLDPTGHEQLRVSRLAMDVVGSNADFSQDPKFKRGDRPQDLLQPGVLPQGVRAVHDDRARRGGGGRGRRRGGGQPEVHLGRGLQPEGRQGRLCLRRRCARPPDRAPGHQPGAAEDRSLRASADPRRRRSTRS